MWSRESQQSETANIDSRAVMKLGPCPHGEPFIAPEGDERGVVRHAAAQREPGRGGSAHRNGRVERRTSRPVRPSTSTLRDPTDATPDKFGELNEEHIQRLVNEKNIDGP